MEVNKNLLRFYITNTLAYYDYYLTPEDQEDVEQECCLAILKSTKQKSLRCLVRNKIIDCISQKRQVAIPRRTLAYNKDKIKIPKQVRLHNNIPVKEINTKNFNFLHDALGSIKQSYADAIWNCLGLGEPISLYARNQGVSRSTIRTRLKKGLSKIKDILNG